MEKKESISVKISPEAKKKLDAMAQSSGMGKIEMVSRLVEWLHAQDRTLQAIAMGQIDDRDLLDVLEMIKCRVASGQAKSSVGRRASRTGGRGGSSAKKPQSAG